MGAEEHARTALTTSSGPCESAAPLTERNIARRGAAAELARAAGRPKTARTIESFTTPAAIRFALQMEIAIAKRAGR